MHQPHEPHEPPPSTASHPRPSVGPPPADSRRPSRIEPFPDTPYGLAIYGAPPVTSGPAVASLVAGVAGILVSFMVAFLGVVGVTIAVAGAFALLSTFLGAVGVGLGVAAIRQTRPAYQPPGQPIRGRGMGIAGLVCGGLALLATVCGLGVALVGITL